MRSSPRLRPDWLRLLLLLLILPGAAASQPFALTRVATGLDRPLYLTAPPGDATRAFVLEQHTGAIRVLDLGTGALRPDPFLTIGGLSQGGEQGLLGLAFHPDYASNGLFYVYTTTPQSNVVRYQVSADPDVADAGSAAPVLSFAQPQGNHNGGWLAFGPDGMLYVASGDGGGGHDDDFGHTPGTGNAQDTSDNLLGKLLRIDVDGDDFPGDPARNYAIPPDNPFVGVAGDDEIWAFGLRNPWRPGFDRATGDLYIADVGQNTCEEINVQPASSAGGENYGWRLREGTLASDGGVGGPHPPGAIDPIFDYPHPDLSCSVPGHGAAFTGFSVTGGVVYRGPIASLRGRYFFADFATASLWSLVWDGSNPALHDGSNFSGLTDHGADPAFAPDQGDLGSIASFGEDAEGNLYVLDLDDGEVFRLPEPGLPPAGLAVLLGLLTGLSALRERSLESGS